jgi:hypothetical protein
MSDLFGTAVRRFAMACMVAALSSGGGASATLLDRGPDLVYDDVLNITWTRNANLPGTSSLTWDQARSWAATLVFAGFDNWRLPFESVAAGVGPTDTVIDCALASEQACRDNELGYMFYRDLGGRGSLNDKRGDQTAIGGQEITNIQQTYWSGTRSTFNNAYGFNVAPFTRSLQVLGFGNIQTNRATGWSVWAVRPGDVGVVPEPSSLLLIGVGMFLLVWTRRSRRQR